MSTATIRGSRYPLSRFAIFHRIDLLGAFLYSLNCPSGGVNGAYLSNEPILLFLHGVGNGDPDNLWMNQLDETLVSLGYPGLDPRRVIVPKYAHALRGTDDKEQAPPVTIKTSPRELAKKNRRDFERRMSAIEFRLGRRNHGRGWLGGEAIIDFAAVLPFFAQVQNYMNKPHVRAQVLKRILSFVPESGKIVIVGHSLGSVIAADLLRRLPIAVEVVGMVTIGSPLAHGKFNVDKLQESLKEPPTNLAWWVNIWNVLDPVAGHRGLSSLFPWMVDFRIQTTLNHHVHDAVEYFKDSTVAEAVGYAMFGSKSREIIRAENGIDVPLDATECIALLGLRYAYLIKMRLEGDIQDRYAGALRHVQASLIDDISRWKAEEGKPMAYEVARLAFDLSDPEAMVPEPRPSNHISKEAAVLMLTVLASENVIRPFEITVHRDKRQAALEDLSAEMGLGSQFGTQVFESTKRAQEVLGAGIGINWKKWGALGAGAAALVVATGGLALAAGAGLAGAAAITSALATFGPGGMIGGLLTAGTLVGAGGGGVAYGLASPGTSAETFEAVIERRLAASILRQQQNLDPDLEVWKTLTATEVEVRRAHERLDEFSDESSQGLKELKRKIESVERALNYLRDNGLEPHVFPQAPSEPENSGRKILNGLLNR